MTPPLRLRALLDCAIAAAQPQRVLPPYLAQISDPRPKGRLIVLGAGKAAAAMGNAVRAHFGPCEGLLITRYGHQGAGHQGAGHQGVGHQGNAAQTAPDIVQAGHPIPDAAGAAATARMLAMVQRLGPDDLVLVLISGGASALLVAPIEGVSLAQKGQITAQLLAKGAPIGDINLIRKQFSRVKGGQLAAACAPARVVGLIISDVAGDDLADIGSGPTIGDGRDAARVAARWGATLPASSGVIGAGDPRLAHVQNHLIAAPMASLRAAAKLAQGWGWRAQILGDDLAGEARDLASLHAQSALDIAAGMRAGDAPCLLLSGGEVTVSLGDAPQGSIGGPNAEYALALAQGLQGHARIHALAADTDGIDGAGTTAGAIIGPDTPWGAQAAQDLRDHNAHGFFTRCGGAITTGPTQTNVNDFRAVLVLPPDPSSD